MKKYLALVGMAMMPLVSFAQTGPTDPGPTGSAGTITDLNSFAGIIANILNIIFPILLMIAVFVIIWGIFRFILNAGDEEARKTGRSFILWGVVGIFLMLSVWGLVRILTNTITFEDNTAITAPEGYFQVVPIE